MRSQRTRDPLLRVVRNSTLNAPCGWGDRPCTRALVLGEDHRVLAEGAPEEVLDDRELLLQANLVHDYRPRARVQVTGLVVFAPEQPLGVR